MQNSIYDILLRFISLYKITLRRLLFYSLVKKCVMFFYRRLSADFKRRRKGGGEGESFPRETWCDLTRRVINCYENFP